MDLLYHLQNLWMAILLGGVLLILTTQWDRSTRAAPTPARRLLRMLAWMFLVVGGVGWWIGVSGFAAVVLVPVICLIVFGFALQRYRVMENRGLMSIVLAGMEKGIPPVASAVAYRQEATGLQEQKAGKLAKALGAGMSVVDAAAVARVFIPAETLLGLELGRCLGNVRSINASSKRFLRDDTTNYGNLDLFLGGLMTVVVVGTFLIAVLTYTSLRIQPVLSGILNDFDLGGSLYSDVWLWVSWCSYGLLWVLYLLIPFTLLLFLLLMLVQFGWLSELPWGLRWMHGPLNECRLLNVLSIVVASEIPLPSAVEIIQRRFPSARIRGIARSMHVQLREGGDWMTALRQARIFTGGEAALARSAAEAGNLAWALKEISVGKRRRHLQRIAPVTKIILPLLVLLAAVPVMLAALGVFLPIIELLVNLS